MRDGAQVRLLRSIVRRGPVRLNDKSAVSIPEPIVQFESKLDQFRSAQLHRTKIPEALWQAAVKLAWQHGKSSRSSAAAGRAFNRRVPHRSIGPPPSCLAGSGTMIHITAQVPVLAGVQAEQLWAKPRRRL